MYIVLFMILIFFQKSKSFNYCGYKKLCQSRPHIGCDPTQIEQESELLGLYPLTYLFKKTVLDEHNKFRSQLACGDVKDKSEKEFPAASQMRQLSWNNELMYLAKTHVKRCALDHDKCRSTIRFPSAGQNLFFAEAPNKIKKSGIELMKQSVRAWFGEYKHADGTDLTQGYQAHEGNETFGHFTAVVNDKAYKIGCAMAQCAGSSHSTKKYFVTCNYSSTNIVGAATYVTGDSASSCDNFKVAKSSDYKCLCKSK